MSETKMSDPKTATVETAETAPGKAGRGQRPSRTGPRMRPLRALRWLWAQLTSMRTALVLLFALALAAIPGSILPQQPKDPFKVKDFLAEHHTLGPIYDKLDLFNVFTSPWFSAIYLLLFISLIGCIVPRVGVYLRAVRAKPPATPRRLSRLPAYARTESDAEPSAVLDATEHRLRSARFRVVRTDTTLSAERGYLREAGNLLFHISLLVLLLGVAISTLTGFRGSSLVVVGQGFSNTLTQYDDITTGQYFNEGSLAPFTVVLNSFQASYETGPVQTGAARIFRAKVSVIDHPGDTPHSELLRVNHPLKIDGTTVHMMSHGYAPTVTVKDGSGNVAYSGPVVFLPQDNNLKSAGVIKAPDGRPDRLAFEGFFLPTGVVGAQGPQSLFPDLFNPMLYLNAWYGPPKVETGKPENVYVLDPDGLTPFENKDHSDRLRFAMSIGDTVTLPDGKGSITFTGVDPWIKLQMSRTPGLPLSIGAVLSAILGLCLSLFIRPRRLWVRVRDAGDPTDGEGVADDVTGGTVIEVAGLDRADARSGLGDDIDRLIAAAERTRTADWPGAADDTATSQAATDEAATDEAAEQSAADRAAPRGESR